MTRTPVFFPRCTLNGHRQFFINTCLPLYRFQNAHETAAEVILHDTYCGLIRNMPTRSQQRIFMMTYTGCYSKSAHQMAAENNFLVLSLMLFQDAQKMRAEKIFSWWQTLGCYSPNANRVAAENEYLWWHTLASYFQNVHNSGIYSLWHVLWSCSQNTHQMAAEINAFYVHACVIPRMHTSLGQKMNFHDDQH